jgi:hypothetical protein
MTIFLFKKKNEIRTTKDKWKNNNKQMGFDFWTKSELVFEYIKAKNDNQHHYGRAPFLWRSRMGRGRYHGHVCGKIPDRH